MPFKSEDQRRFMWAEHPDIAQRWTQEAIQRRMRKKKKQTDTEDKTVVQPSSFSGEK